MNTDESHKLMNEIVTNTVDWYSNNPRALADDLMERGDYCRYLTTDKNRCSFARYINDENIERIHDEYEGMIAGDVLHVEGNDSILKSSVRGLSWDFWSDLQQFHDSGLNWLEGGLSGDGVDVVKSFRQDIAGGEYDNLETWGKIDE